MNFGNVGQESICNTLTSITNGFMKNEISGPVILSSAKTYLKYVLICDPLLESVNTDGKARLVTLQSGKSTHRRPINKLVIVILMENQSSTSCGEEWSGQA